MKFMDDALLNKDEPNKLAIVCEEKSISYFYLNKYSKCVSKIFFNRFKLSNKDIVLIFLDKGIENIIAMFGSLYSGAVYLNIDISLPFEKIQYIFKNSNPSLVVTNTENVITLKSFLKDYTAFIVDNIIIIIFIMR